MSIAFEINIYIIREIYILLTKNISLNREKIFRRICLTRISNFDTKKRSCAKSYFEKWKWICVRVSCLLLPGSKLLMDY